MSERTSFRWIRFIMARSPLVGLGLGLLFLAGLAVSPFPGDYGGLPRSPLPVDALPNVGENQQIVFAEWPGSSPQDVEDQVTYPLTSALLGVSGVKTIRSSSMFGLSMLYVVFEEDMGFYESRTRLLEKISSLPPRLLPDGVSPALGPDATPLGQVYMYTLEGRSSQGATVGGWSLHELRSIQDFTVRYALQAVPGVSEVASIGGYVRELQVDVDPDALEAAQVDLMAVARAVQASSRDAGLRTLEINRMEYILRSEGTAKGLQDVRRSVVTWRQGVPITVGDLAHVHYGPAQRRGALDDSGAEVVGGIVTVQEGANPLEVIQRVKEHIEELQPSLPRRALEGGTRSQVTVVPYYDRSGLILETLNTLRDALSQQILITLLVVLVMLRHLSGALLISSLLPLGVLGAFLLMKLFRIDAHIMALSGIAIAIGTMVDMGIVLTENIIARLQARAPSQPRLSVIVQAAGEVTPAVLTSTLTTVVSFFPIFALTEAEGKMFRPLAFTKTFAVLSALGLAVLALPPLARWFLHASRSGHQRETAVDDATHRVDASGGHGRQERGPHRVAQTVRRGAQLSVGLGLWILLSSEWRPLGPGASFSSHLVFVGLALFSVLGSLQVFMALYPRLLDLCLRHPVRFLTAPVCAVVTGLLVWLGAPTLLGWLPASIQQTLGGAALFEAFPGLDREYMPPFDEGSFLVMPTTMPHASFGEALRLLQLMDARIAQIPEVDRVVGKLGRAETALDPAPISMFETLVTYVPEFGPDPDGTWVRQWRPHIESPTDIWAEIREAARIPGLTGAPRLQPIETRQVMLQSGMRSSLGVQLQGPTLEALQDLGRQLEDVLREVPGIQPDTVQADQVMGKPQLEIRFNRSALTRHGLTLADAQAFLETAVAGRSLATLEEGRERYDIRIRLMREERNSLLSLQNLRVRAGDGAYVPLSALAEISYVRSPQSIRSEDGFLTSYVVFDGRPDVPQSELVARVQRAVESARVDGRLQVPLQTRWRIAGTWEAQQRSQRQLAWLVPLTSIIVFFLLYAQFRSVVLALIVFAGISVAISGAFILLGLFGVPDFLQVHVFGRSLREVLGVQPIQMSVAVWVGIIALIGIATDDGVVMATYLTQSFRDGPPKDPNVLRTRILEAALRRVRPCLMTTGTTFLALLPVLTSPGRGADLMRPMAVPLLGGMVAELLTLFLVPVLYALYLRYKPPSRLG